MGETKFADKKKKEGEGTSGEKETTSSSENGSKELGFDPIYGTRYHEYLGNLEDAFKYYTLDPRKVLERYIYLSKQLGKPRPKKDTHFFVYLMEGGKDGTIKGRAHFTIEHSGSNMEAKFHQFIPYVQAKAKEKPDTEGDKSSDTASSYDKRVEEGRKMLEELFGKDNEKVQSSWVDLGDGVHYNTESGEIKIDGKADGKSVFNAAKKLNENADKLGLDRLSIGPSLGSSTIIVNGKPFKLSYGKTEDTKDSSTDTSTTSTSESDDSKKKDIAKAASKIGEEGDAIDELFAFFKKYAGDGAEMVIGFSPLGDLYDLTSAVVGKSPITDKPLDTTDRVISFIAAGIPLLPAKVLSYGKKAIKWFIEWVGADQFLKRALETVRDFADPLIEKGKKYFADKFGGGDGVSELSSTLLAALRKKRREILKKLEGKLSKLDPDVRKRFEKDFDTFDEKTLDAFDKNPDLVDSWGVLDGAGLDKKMRQNLDELNDLDYTLKKLGKSKDSAIEEIKNAGDYNSWKKLQNKKISGAIQKSNTDLITNLKNKNPKLSNKQIADAAKDKIEVPKQPFGYSKIKFLESQDYIKKELKKYGVDDAEGFATGSRITGMVTNPKKVDEFGKSINDFSKRDLDITIISSTPLDKKQLAQLAFDYKTKFGHKLGIRYVTDKKQLNYLPIYGKLPINLK